MSEKDIARILEAVHCDRKVRSEHLPIVNKGIVDGQLPHFKQRDIKAILAGGPSGQLSAKVSYVIGLLNGVEKCSELIARLLFMASDQKELGNVVSFALTLSPIFPNVVTLGVGYLVSNIRQLTIEFQKEEEANDFANNRFSETSGYLPSGTRWLKNLLTLISWKKHAPEDSLLNCLGLNLADIRGDLQVGLFNWALSYLDLLDKGNGWDKTSSEVFICFLDLLKMVCPKVQLPIRACNRLIVLFSALVVLLLKLIKKENFGSSFDGVDMVCHCYAIAGLFFTSQQSVDRSVLITSLLNDMFENSAAIIGTKKNLSSIVSEISFDKFPPSFLLGQDLDEFSFLKDLRSTSSNSRTAHGFAHTGQLRKRVKESGKDSEEEEKMLRIFLFVNMIEIICMKSSNQELSLKQCKHLGLKLIEEYCLDGLTSGFGWNNWEWEREQLSSYIEVSLPEIYYASTEFFKISKKLEETPFINNFLLQLGSTKGGIWFALPLLRSRFVYLLSELEKAILKDAKVSEKNLDVISSVFSVFVAANFIPVTLIALFDVICVSTNHQVYVVLMSLWKLIQSKWPANEDVPPIEPPLSDALLLKEEKGVQFVEMVLLVGQSHISEAKVSFAKLVNICYESENQ